MEVTWEPIGGGLCVPVTAHCRFTEDAVHLARFAAPTPEDTVCDLGSGSGILPLLFCRHTPPVSIAAVEREEAFAALLRQAVDKFSLEKRITVYVTDWANEDAMPGAHSMSLVTCNPPYFPFGASRTGNDPLRTAMRHEDHPHLLATVCTAASRLLTPNGRFCLCHRPSRTAAIQQALNTAGLTVRRTQTVQATNHSAPSLLLIEAGFGGEAEELPPIVLFDAPPQAVYKRLYPKETLANRRG